MTADDALAFLRANQPLPPQSRCSDELIQTLNEVREYFLASPDPRCIPLLLGVFNDGDGHGVFQLIDKVIWHFPNDDVLPHLVRSLSTGTPEAKYWSTQIATHYDDPVLAEPLIVLAEQAGESQYFAVLALSLNLAVGVSSRLRKIRQTVTDSELIGLLDEVVAERDRSSLP
uniref:HEAT repeat domain-containing protein n=1 Tax=Schlesneria paludicola TaxID=360056 RepID=A0A7C2JZ41_9PLAN